MSKRPGPNKDNLEATRKIFMDIAKLEFCNHGYSDASTTRIVTKSGMARGSLYYHFGDKNGLFKAVYEELLDDALICISQRMDVQDNPLDSYSVVPKHFWNSAFRTNSAKSCSFNPNRPWTIASAYWSCKKHYWESYARSYHF